VIAAAEECHEQLVDWGKILSTDSQRKTLRATIWKWDPALGTDGVGIQSHCRPHRRWDECLPERKALRQGSKPHSSTWLKEADVN
jgi:hypothetical protein